MLTVKYERKDFFGNRIYTEDSKNHYSHDDLRKAFLFFSKEHDIAIQIDNVIIFWDNISEYDNKVVTVRNYDGRNCTEVKKSFEKVKKEEYGKI